MKEKIEIEIPDSIIERITLNVIEEVSRRIDADDVMSVHTAAALLGISDSSMYAIIRDNPDFPTVRVGRRIKIIRSEMINWLKGRDYVFITDFSGVDKEG